MKQLAALALGLLAVLEPSAVALAENRQVNADSLYVRLNPQGFFVGTLYRNAGFYRQQTSGDYAYGYAGGNFQGCGWVETAWTVAGGNTTPGCTGPGFTGTGAASRQYLLDHYASRVNDYIPGQSLPLKNAGNAVRIKSGVVAGFYGNYRGGSHQNLYFNIDASTPLAWRWVSDDGRSVAVNIFPGEPNALWGFVLREKLPDLLPYSDGVSR
ncbi:hypothetical protein [Luteimonas aquatica]|uniref:hypothetical protein n=1 Tax=Luteimonas aquatica TaxID=450364 RepID=UPI001F57EDB4|nr:hypothetical protein [Luteimonas aquatica]